MKYEQFSPKQITAMLWWNMDQYKDMDTIICDGSIRSGKTIAMTVGFILWSMSNFNGQRFAMCGKTIESLRRNVILPMETQWLKGIVKITEHRNEHNVVVEYGRRKNTYYIFGGKDEGSAALIQGMTLAGVLLDEVALMPRSFVEQALGRCSIMNSKFWLNCNPDGPQHWFFLEWIQKAKEKNALHLHFTMADNYSLNDKIIRRYESMYSGLFYDRYILGLWRVAEGAIYDMFSKEKHVRDYTEKYYQKYISIDYGTYNPCVFLEMRRKEKNGKTHYHVEKEYYYDGRQCSAQKTDEEYLDDLEKFCDGNHGIPLIVDPSASSFITAAKRRGWRVIQAVNDVLPGIRTVASKLSTECLTVSETCTHTISEFQSYVWNEKSARAGCDDPVKQNDHCMDALRYGVYYFERKVFVRIYDHKPC